MANTYHCPCGRSFRRSTNAECTGLKLENYGEEHECWGCPYVMAHREWSPSQHELVIDHYFCRASKGEIVYTPTSEFNLINTNSGYVYTLDRPMILQLIRFYLTLDGNGVTFSPESDVNDEELERRFMGASLYKGKRVYAFPWKSSKAGLRDKKIFYDKFISLRGDLTEDQWRDRIRAYTPMPDAYPKQCPHYRGIDKVAGKYQISCDKWVGPKTTYEVKKNAQSNANLSCLCDGQYQSCRFYQQAEREDEKMVIEYPQPGEGMCPCYGGASAKKGGGHLIRCGKWESPLQDDGSYLQRIKMCSGDGLDGCRFYLLWWMQDNGHGEEAVGKSDDELRNIYRGYRMKQELAAEKETAIEPAPAAPVPDKPEHPRSPEELAVAISFYKAQTVQNIIEIGRCLIEAKAQLNHGEWQIWLQEKAEISIRRAEIFMRLANEMGEKTNTYSFLTYSKALALLAVPADEREDFIEATHTVAGQEKTVDEMSVRELKKVIRERDEALKQLEDRGKANMMLCEDVKALKQMCADRDEANGLLRADLDAAERKIADKDKALRELESRPVDVAVAEPTEEQLEEMRAEIRRELEREVPQNMYLSIKAAERAVSVFNNAIDAALGHLIEVEQTRPYIQASRDIEDAIQCLRVKIERLDELREAMLQAERRRDEHADDIDF